MTDTVWAAIWGAAAAAAFAFAAAERQRLNAQRAQIIDEARREVAPKLDDYGHWLVEVRVVFADLFGEECNGSPGLTEFSDACQRLDEIASEREHYAERLRVLRYYRVPLPEYTDIAQDLALAHTKLGEALDMAWMYFRFDVDVERCRMLATIMMAAVSQYAILVAKVRDSVLDDVLQPIFHPIAGRRLGRAARRAARRESSVDFAVDRHSTNWDPLALKYEKHRWVLGERLLIHHPDLQELLSEDWNPEAHPPRESAPGPRGA